MARKLGSVSEWTLYILSEDNMSREDMSVRLVGDLISSLDRALSDFMSGPVGGALARALMSRVSLRVVGRLEGIPAPMLAALTRWRGLCTGSQLRINLAVNYDGGRDCLGEYGARDQSQIDLVFRSGGEHRLSGFFPMHTLYSEIFFTDLLWPEVGARDLYDALVWYSTRSRRFGR